jgi:hypothetical protein
MAQYRPERTIPIVKKPPIEKVVVDTSYIDSAGAQELSYYITELVDYRDMLREDIRIKVLNESKTLSAEVFKWVKDNVINSAVLDVKNSRKELLHVDYEILAIAKRLMLLITNQTKKDELIALVGYNPDDYELDDSIPEVTK